MQIHPTRTRTLLLNQLQLANPVHTSPPDLAARSAQSNAIPNPDPKLAQALNLNWPGAVQQYLQDIGVHRYLTIP